jgi:hypothetical protein
MKIESMMEREGGYWGWRGRREEWREKEREREQAPGSYARKQ